MQQVTNVLLSSPDSIRKVTDSQSKSTEAKTNSEGDSFSAALEKAEALRLDEQRNTSANAEPAANAQSASAQSTNEEALAESCGKENTQTEAADPNASSQALKQEARELEQAQDDVSQIFAQINLANNFGGDSQLAVNGESLPLSAEQLESNSSKLEQLSNELAVSDLSDEALIALSLQSGLSEQELSKLSSSELKALLQQGQMLDASGGLKSEFAVVSTLQSSPVEMRDSATKAEVGDKAAQGSIVTDAKGANATDIKGAHTGRDIFGKEVAGQTANQALADQGKAAQNLDGANSNNAINTMATSQEQLKGAELSVRITATQAGLEANLAGMSESGTQELKSISGLHNQQLQQPGASRQELPQLQLALKQPGEQTPSMQQMIQRFSPMMNQQLITMVSKGVQQAEIRLDPPELGHMMVRIQVQGDTTQVQFQVSQHQTRDLVEQAMPRLREMLAEQGMQLTDGQVSQGNGGNSQGEQGLGNGNGRSDVETDEISAEDLLARSNLSTSSASGIDYYA
ncbi:flagellar hook-length control protein FliK [Shewanella schlegeliana]|uniref:Flagellar hook-length control protein FliK n=1 Tax=Shewanella schlegeliana TaxID=190308 RepID=A0ABS1SSV3_9GAMM|nr:flagellar hook-length control protein FliK [Shewanella schlegeliana]MBL4911588.1 flagellar hook-length control protein FliK [Shewanella schlegeliana]MCL1111728.1 flagellar hook-length control protein FliK [Shewanella schlegeliana]GIU36157.1 flagellar hook-length control protein FliK [Shewanella schlegeliana]